ncbi:hypothetical protein [Micromonospora sp. LOL_023]|uniref:hypothetical protein n=1 Tax=Micromonospora sp. LOL_023 TaxID=3345418 RepID=UPI003A86EF74
MRATRIGVPLLLACLVLLPACGPAESSTEPDPTEPTSTATVVTTPSAAPSPSGGSAMTPTPPAQTPGPPEDLPSVPPGGTPGGPGTSSRPMTLSGTVQAGVENNCFLLDGYLLLGGSPDLVRAGARVTVTGHVQADLMTTCQQGIPFKVQRVEPA